MSQKARSVSPQRWLGSVPVIDKRLPADLQEAIKDLMDVESVETLGDWIEEVRRRADGESVDHGDLCFADEETSNRAVIDGETFHFECFYEALVMAELKAAPAEIRTESPDGTIIETEVTQAGDLTITPSEAVVSFGVDAAGGDLSEAVYPYVRAFPDRDAYERWASEVPAATVAMGLEESMGIARAFADA